MGTRKSVLLVSACIGAAALTGFVSVWHTWVRQDTPVAAVTTDELEELAQQSVPGYHGIIEFNTAFQMLLGKNVIEDVADNKIVRLKNKMLTFVCDPADVTPSVDGILNIKNVCDENGIQLLYVQAPQKISKFDSQLPAGVQDYGNEIADDFLSQIDGTVPYIDLRQTIYDAGINQYDLFFKTDHHWTPEGAFWCWGQVAQTLKSDYGLVFDDSICEADSYTWQTYPKWFLGSEGKRVGTIYGGIDDFTVITPKFETDFDFYVPSKGIERHGCFADTLMNKAMYETKDYYNANPYEAYIGGDFALNRIVNKVAPNHKKVLLIRDSFACAFTPFLALSCEQVETIDKRAFQGTIADYIAESKPDMVMFLYNTSAVPGAANFE